MNQYKIPLPTSITWNLLKQWIQTRIAILGRIYPIYHPEREELKKVLEKMEELENGK